jgi:hypothetical protein
MNTSNFYSDKTRWLLFILLMQFLQAPAQQGPVGSPWNPGELYETPEVYPTTLCKVDRFESFFYEGSEFKASRTRVFAYYKAGRNCFSGLGARHSKSISM